MISSDRQPSPEDARYETFIARFAHHEPDLRRFIRSLLPTAVDADEVLQQTAIVIWRKFEQYDPDTNFMKRAGGIASLPGFMASKFVPIRRLEHSMPNLFNMLQGR